MKKTLLLVATLAATASSFADEWQKPIYSGKYKMLEAGSTVYIYNTDAHLFLGEGNDYGTHATVGDRGTYFRVKQHLDENDTWDGVNYTIEDYSLSNDGWFNMFITDYGNVYNDRKAQDDYFFTFTDLGNNTYQIMGSDINPQWKTSGDFSGYMLGHYTGYTNTKDNIQTGTGVIYDLAGDDSNYEKGEFNTTWAFVDEVDYIDYEEKLSTYEAAIKLGEVIKKADGLGATGLDAEKSVYANTASSKEEIEEAIKSAEQKILDQMEVIVTPDNPQTIFTDECNNIENWTNGINADTWGTQSWIADGWSGFNDTTLNIWGSSLNGNASITKTNLPKGIYVIDMAVYSESMDGYVYANDNKKTVVGGALGQVYNVTTNVTDGCLEFGFGQDSSGKNWVAIDNATVKYYGNGAKALKYWLNSLKDSSTDLDDAVFETALKSEYDAVLGKVDAAETDNEILAVIKEYEAVLDKISISIDAYTNLSDAIKEADNIITNELCNTYYGDQLSDMKDEKGNVYETHTLSADKVNEETKELKALCEEAMQYIWNVEKLNSELETAAGIYAEYEDSATEGAKTAYKDFVAANSSLKEKDLKADEVQALINELYKIEFNLSLKDEEASDDNPVDYTARIFNNGFVGTDGWTNDGWNTFANNTKWSDFGNEDGASSANEDGYYLNLWNDSAADCYQVVNNLPAGAYTLTFGAYADKDGLEVYANDNSLKIATGQDAAYNYMHVYTIDVIIGDEGTLKIGIRNTAEGEMWAMADEFRLEYKGTSSSIMTGVDAVEPAVAKTTDAYTISGVKAGNDATATGIIIKNGKKYYNK